MDHRIIKNETIAVVGMAGVFPGAHRLETFWENIVNRVDTTNKIPDDRWIVPTDVMVRQNLTPDKAYSKRACLISTDTLTRITNDLNDIDIDPDLIGDLDPLYPIVLYTGRNALDGCHMTEAVLSRTGVILAAIALPTDTASALNREILGNAFEENIFGHRFSYRGLRPISRNRCFAGHVTGLPGAILAKGLRLGGGSFTLDAACASSIFAVKYACNELMAHRADAMLVGGVSRPECLYTQVGFTQLQALSPSGRCAPFDAGADGLVTGEGAGILVLKRLSDALNSGDSIYALIRGIGLSNDMGGNLLAPDSEGQLRAMHAAYAMASWSPADIDLFECHGAGTPLGDATELKSLTTLLKNNRTHGTPTAIGSIKSMIGHLLTAAGAAGMIKTLLALKHKTLPPSLHFNRFPENIAIDKEVLKVQTIAEKWVRRKDSPRRAAVSAFGFGGTNGHILFEEWRSESGKTRRKQVSTNPERIQKRPLPNAPCPVAIVGMDTIFGSLHGLRDFQETLLQGRSIIRQRPRNRWKGSETIAAFFLANEDLPGGYMDHFFLSPGEFRIPPKEIPDIIPQHLLMLKVAAAAFADAGIQATEKDPRRGIMIGLDFDFEATDFHLRWHLHNAVETWNQKYGLRLNTVQRDAWRDRLMDEISPPLTHSRTLGALGGIIAARITREFRCGSPSMVVSAAEASGLKALETATRSLQQKEADVILVGAVDLYCDVRHTVMANGRTPFSTTHRIRPFDRTADGTLPGEGAAAVVLKRLDQAIDDGDRIYAVLTGCGNASHGGIDRLEPSKRAYRRSLERCFRDAGITPDTLGFFETHGSGHPPEDTVELHVLNDLLPPCPEPCAIGSTKPIIGHTGAVSGLASLIKTCLCLFQEILPPLINYSAPLNDHINENAMHIPVRAQYWLRNREDGPRRACVAAITADGNCTHAILEEHDHPDAIRVPSQINQERIKPTGLNSVGLFFLDGKSSDDLLSGLDRLTAFIDHHTDCQANMELGAWAWFHQNRYDPDRPYAVALVANNPDVLRRRINDARQRVKTGIPQTANNRNGIYFTPEPIGTSGKIAWVYPGSGNPFIGMGRDIGVQWPEIYRQMDRRTAHLKAQMRPDCFMPHRHLWINDWEGAALKKVTRDPLNMIFGQVSYGMAMTELLHRFEIKPQAVIGYSLGESAAMFATGAWPDPDEMRDRMERTGLFKTELFGPCRAAREMWNVPPDEDVQWTVAVVNRPPGIVRQAIGKGSTARLLIVNTLHECVIGGRKPHVDAVIQDLSCEAVFLEGVATVHCDALTPVADAYRAIHRFPVTPPQGIAYYSCASGKTYHPTPDRTADAILAQARDGFNFSDVINKAYADGIRVFIETGPQSSCTRMIRNILNGKPHFAVSASSKGKEEYRSVIALIGAMIAERIPLNPAFLYDNAYFPAKAHALSSTGSKNCLVVCIGGAPPCPIQPPSAALHHPADAAKTIEPGPALTHPDFSEMIAPMQENFEAVSDAHQSFLNFSSRLTGHFEKAFVLQTRLIEAIAARTDVGDMVVPLAQGSETSVVHDQTPFQPAFSRDMCMQFATGSVAAVLGPEFAEIDTYPVRVRLPDEPLMLVDRILSVDGKKMSLDAGRVVTEHDVHSSAWYLDGDRAPVCISVEAGQADLFLSSYLGIDHVVKGKRAYRLLDATVKFHRGLPRPGDVIRYEIEIDKFVRQGETYLFFFRFNGYIGDDPLITMMNGCAGFFTSEEVTRSGGILPSDETLQKQELQNSEFKNPPVPVKKERYSDSQLSALRKGRSDQCFGTLFQGIVLAKSTRLPGGRMKLIDRILSLDPSGGRYGAGAIRAEADIHPDDWFLTCHFVDDRVMPGTLMYECCAHTLRVFMQRMGWVTEKEGVCYEPVIGVESVLKCRGPVTPETRTVHYEIEIKEIGYGPEPYAIADAHMYADGNYIVYFQNMSMKMTGITRDEIETFWQRRKTTAVPSDTANPPRHDFPDDRNEIEKKDDHRPTPPTDTKPLIFGKDQLLAFAAGNPSEAFGRPYAEFDQHRFIARLPQPPYLFIDRILSAAPEPWVLAPDGWIEAACDIEPDAWYFKAERSSAVPYSILLEIALQPCGWLAAYMGSALKSQKDLRFRNLGGEASLHRELLNTNETVITRARLTRVSEAGEMILEHYDFQMRQGDDIIFDGQTYFGFFTQSALAGQAGLRDGPDETILPPEPGSKPFHNFSDIRPLSPDDDTRDSAPPLAMPANAIRMIDAIETYHPDGGAAGLGLIRGIKRIDPDEWFFKAHFFQDPVCPGSLGIESFLQLLKFMALQRWGHLSGNHRFSLLCGRAHQWTYRGQITPENKTVIVEASVTEIQDLPIPVIRADGYLNVDGRYIYKLNNYGITLTPI